MNRRIFLPIFYIYLAFFSLSSASLNAGEMTDARINIGLKLFRAILAADLAIKTKKNSQDKLSILLIYKDSPIKGNKFSQDLLEMGIKNGHARIKGIPLQVSPMSYQQFLTAQPESLAGIFLVDKIPTEELIQIASYGIKNHIIVYSPFEHDLENNVTASLHIGARVRPVINMKTLEASNIQIKSFFLKVAKIYEP